VLPISDSSFRLVLETHSLLEPHPICGFRGSIRRYRSSDEPSHISFFIIGVPVRTRPGSSVPALRRGRYSRGPSQTINERQQSYAISVPVPDRIPARGRAVRVLSASDNHLTGLVVRDTYIFSETLKVLAGWDITFSYIIDDKVCQFLVIFLTDDQLLLLRLPSRCGSFGSDGCCGSIGVAWLLGYIGLLETARITSCANPALPGWSRGPRCGPPGCPALCGLALGRALSCGWRSRGAFRLDIWIRVGLEAGFVLFVLSTRRRC
jgi:hypothetical protein